MSKKSAQKIHKFGDYSQLMLMNAIRPYQVDGIHLELSYSGTSKSVLEMYKPVIYNSH